MKECYTCDHHQESICSLTNKKTKYGDTCKDWKLTDNHNPMWINVIILSVFFSLFLGAASFIMMPIIFISAGFITCLYWLYSEFIYKKRIKEGK